MPVTSKNKKTANKKISAIIDPSVGNYEKHPYFVKKANEAKALIEKVGLPEEYYAQNPLPKKRSVKSPDFFPAFVFFYSEIC